MHHQPRSNDSAAKASTGSNKPEALFAAASSKSNAGKAGCGVFCSLPSIVNVLASVSHSESTFFFATDENARWVAVSDNVPSVLGVTANDLLGLGFYKFCPGDTAEEVNAWIRALEAGSMERMIGVSIAGKYVFAKVKLASLAGMAKCYCGSIEVFTASEVRGQSWLLNVFEVASDIVISFTKEGRCVFFRSPDDYIPLHPIEYYQGRYANELWPDEFALPLQNAIARVSQTGKPEHFSHRLRVKDQVRYFQTKAIRTGDNEVTAVLRDVTSTNALRSLYDSVLDVSPWLSGLFRLDGQPIKLNQLWSKKTGLSLESLYGLKLFDMISPSDRELMQAALENATKSRALQAVYAGLLLGYDERINVRWQISFNANDNVFYLCGDIVESRPPMPAETGDTDESKFSSASVTSTFLGMIAHEIRNPLSVISMVNMHLAESADTMRPDERLSHHRSIETASNRINTVTSEMMLLAKLEAGKATIDWEILELKSWVSGLIGETQILNACPRPSISLLCKGDVHVRADKRLLSHALHNLLGNAIKYSQEGKAIDVRISGGEDSVSIEIEDHGIGIPAKDIAQMFTSFFRASNVNGRKGTGIGLVLVKRCVDAIGGKVSFRTMEGLGTTFTIQLPKAQVKT